MHFNDKKLDEFLKSSLPPSTQTLKNFKDKVQSFLKKATMQNDEEYQKNEINDFLKQVFSYSCNTKNKIDSAIYVDHEVQVIIEVKRLDNKKEFPQTPQNPLSKAFCEAVLYFLRERNARNNSLKHIILCNPYEFFVFDAKEFDVFETDAHIKKLYKNCDKKEGTNSSTKTFYEDLEQYLKETNDIRSIAYAHFSLLEALRDDATLSLIYQLLSPQVLLKQKVSIDANTLNQNFYEELLYILGLEEKNEGGKILIIPSKTQNTLSYAIKQQYSNLSDEEIFSLLTTWNNRILFFRLL